MAIEGEGTNIPKADYAVVGGSGTLSSNFPANLPDEDVKILADNLYFETPYGKVRRFGFSASAKSAC